MTKKNEPDSIIKEYNGNNTNTSDEDSVDSQQIKKEKLAEKEQRTKRFSAALSLLVAIILWMFVVQTESPTITKPYYDVPVQFLNEDSLAARGLAVSSGVTPTVRVTLEGKRTEIIGLSQNDIKATANLNPYSKGENYIPVEVDFASTTRLSGINVIDIRPSRVKVDLENLVTVNKSVKVIFTGETDKDKEAMNLSTSPIDVAVSGPRSSVANVSYLKAEVPVNELSTVSKIIQVDLVPCDKDGAIVSAVKLETKTVDVKAQLYQIREVPLTTTTIGTLGKTLSLISMDLPDTVQLVGPMTVIKDITSISAEPIDLSQIKASAKVRLSLDLPEKVSVYSSGGNVLVSIEVAEIPSKSFKFSTSDIVCENFTANGMVTIRNSDITVAAYGEADVIEGLKQDDIELYIDCTGIPWGDSTLKIEANHKKSLKLIEIIPESVSISLVRN